MPLSLILNNQVVGNEVPCLGWLLAPVTLEGADCGLQRRVEAKFPEILLERLGDLGVVVNDKAGFESLPEVCINEAKTLWKVLSDGDGVVRMQIVEHIELDEVFVKTTERAQVGGKLLFLPPLLRGAASTQRLQASARVVGVPETVSISARAETCFVAKLNHCRNTITRAGYLSGSAV